MAIRILLVDDHEVVRFGLCSLLERHEEFAVVGEAEDGLEAVELASELLPDIIIMDVNMPRMNGIEAARSIRKQSPHSKIIVLSMHRQKQYVLDMLEAGACGYILKTKAIQEVIPAIEAVLEGDVYLCPKVAAVTTKALVTKDRPDDSNRTSELTSRERQVLQLLAEGHSSRQMGDVLGVSEATVVKHRQNLMDKLDLRSVAELTKYAIQHGITSLEI
ncbi:MAG: response regulator transcription factor [Phycisphaeraceae bacterium]|nr:response regulator transcription factor [Phycisphaeraceae bacterium]